MTEFERQALLAQKDVVRRIARRLVYDAQEIDDVVQETWAAGLRQEEAPSRGWLARTVRNLAQTRARAAKRRRLREQAAARPEADPATDEVVAKAELQQQVVDAVLALPEPYRTTILLRYYENLPPRRIAQRMGAPVSTVKTRLERGHRKLRETLDRKHGGRGAWMGALLPLLSARALALTGASLMAKKTFGIAAALLLIAGTVHLATREGDNGALPDRARRDVATTPGTTEPTDRTVTVAGERLSGRVVDQDGLAVASARVHRLPAGHSQHSIPGPPSLSQLRASWESARTLLPSRADAVTDSEGHFTLAAEHGTTVLVRATGFLTRRVESPFSVPIVLEPKPHTQGTVLAPDGTPLPDARVHLLADGALALARTVSDADGRFAFSGEATGSDLLVEHRNHPPLHHNLSQLRAREVTVRMSDWKRLFGVVLDAESRAPIAGAEVYLASYVPLMPWSTTSGPDGTFEFRHGASQGFCSIVVDAGARGNRTVNTDSTAEAALEVLLRPTTSIRGRVVGPSPQEIAGLLLSASQEAHFTREARTNERGEFVIEGVTTDAKLLVIFDPWHETWEPEPDVPEFDQGDRDVIAPPFPPELTLRLKRKSRLSGRVVDAEGKPIPGALLDCRFGVSRLLGYSPIYTYPRVRPTTTDEEGRFVMNAVTTRFDTLPISIRADGFALGRLDLNRLSPGEERVGEEIRLSRGLEITGQVRFGDGRPAAGFKVAASRSVQGELPPFDQIRSSATTDEDGRYRIGALPPGEYYVSVRAGDDFMPAWRSGVSADSECNPLILTEGHQVTGTVTDEQGVPLFGVLVTVQTPDYRPANRVRTLVDGTFVAPQLKPGTYNLHFWFPEYLGHYEREVTVPRSEPLAVTLGRGLAIRGVIFGADGKPRGSVHLRAERTAPRGNHQGSGGQAFSDRAGRFEITGLSEGEFTLTADQHDRSLGDSFRPVERVTAGSEITLRAIRGSLLEMRLVDAAGAAVQEVQVLVISEEEKGAAGRAIRDDAGVFRAGPLLGERFTVLANRGAEYGFAEGVAAGAGPITVVLGRGKSIAGRLVDAAGKPAKGNIALTLKRLPHHTTHLMVLEADGVFRFTGLPDGEYWIRATSPRSMAVGPSGRSVRAGEGDLELVVPAE